MRIGYSKTYGLGQVAAVDYTQRQNHVACHRARGGEYSETKVQPKKLCSQHEGQLEDEVSRAKSGS